MKNGRRHVVQSEGEEYLHKAAWAVVKRQIEHAEANLRGALYDDLVAMVFAYHCLEGYLNFVGDKIAPELWSDERTTFRGAGIVEKLGVICERCGIAVPEKGRRPYATVTELKKLRDRMAHPRTHRARGRAELPASKPPPLFPKSYLATLVTHQKALRARDDVKCIADRIHIAAVARFPQSGLGHDAFEGIHSMRSTFTSLAPSNQEG